MMHSITAVIPVRAGSKRLPHKNILPFGESNLLVHKIRQLKLVKGIDNIVVASDSQEMLDMALAENVKIYKRPEIYCDDTTSPFVNIAENVRGDSILWAVCVCPLLLPQSYQKAIELYQSEIVEKQNYDSLMSVRLFKEYLWNDKGPVNYGLGKQHVISQKLPNYYVVTNGIYIYEREGMRKNNYFLGSNPMKFIVSKTEAIDIDDADDYEMARGLYNMKQGGGGANGIVFYTLFFPVCRCKA